MSSIDDKLNEVLNITPEVIEASEISTVEETKEMIVPIDKDAEIDFDTGRENLYKMLDKGNDAIDGILALAKEGEHPRAYEVAGQLIKTVADVSKDLMAMQEKLKKLKEVPNQGPTSADKDDDYTYTTTLDFFDDGLNYDEETGNDV